MRAAIFFVWAFIVLIFSPATAPALDRESMECLSCHDAALATDATLQVCPEPNCDHPFGLDYTAISIWNRGLRPVSSLPQPIRLVDSGAIGCGTCHVPFDMNDHSILSNLRNLYPSIPDPMLVMDNRRSELCYGCHLK